MDKPKLEQLLFQHPKGMRYLTILVKAPMLRALDSLIERGFYKDRDEAVQTAIKDAVRIHEK